MVEVFLPLFVQSPRVHAAGITHSVHFFGSYYFVFAQGNVIQRIFTWTVVYVGHNNIRNDMKSDMKNSHK